MTMVIYSLIDLRNGDNIVVSEEQLENYFPEIQAGIIEIEFSEIVEL